MERANRILNHDLFVLHLGKNREAEADRIFCRHDMAHFLDVARIGMIINLEDGLALNREWIYAAALLHDLGRHIQYENGTPHEQASGEIAPRILADCGFDDSETSVIDDAILHHRDSSVLRERSLRSLLYRADKASRACFSCEARLMCDWKKEKKNLTIKY